MVVDANHPAVPAPLGPDGMRLTYAGSTSGDYSGLDPTSRPGRYARASRFGRVVWQRWMRTDGSADWVAAAAAKLSLQITPRHRGRPRKSLEKGS